MREMELPARLAEKIDAFRQRGLTPDYQEGLFLQQSWLSVFIGQGAVPEAFDPRVTAMSVSDRHAQMERIHSAIAERAEPLEPHLSFIEKYGAAYRGKGIGR